MAMPPSSSGTLPDSASISTWTTTTLANSLKRSIRSFIDKSKPNYWSRRDIYHAESRNEASLESGSGVKSAWWEGKSMIERRMVLQRSAEIDALLKEGRETQYQILVLGAEGNVKDAVWLALKKLGTDDGTNYTSSNLSEKNSSSVVREAWIKIQGDLTKRLIILDLPSSSSSQTQKFIQKSMHHFDLVTSIVFVVDLSCYDKLADPVSLSILDSQVDPTEEGINTTTTKMDESLAVFSIIVNAPWFRRCSIMLFLANEPQLASKLTSLDNRPLQDFYPDYAGGDKVELALEFLIAKFKMQMDPDPYRSIHAFYLGNVEGIDMTKLRFVVAAMTDIAIGRGCRLLCAQ